MVEISYSQAKMNQDYRHLIACVLWETRRVEIPNSGHRFCCTIVPAWKFFMLYCEATYDKDVRKWTHFDIIGADTRIFLE